MAADRQAAASVIITTHNRPELALRAIGSALSQSLPNVEVIVVDDGSTPPLDASGLDARVIRVDTPVGVCAARNAALEIATGQWITFLDDDDELTPVMLETSIRAAQDSRLPAPVAVLSAMEFVDGDGAVLDRRTPVSSARGRSYFLEPAEPGRSFQVHNTLVAPLLVLKEIGGWDQDIKAWEHDDLFLRLNAVCSLQGVDAVGYRKTAGVPSQLSRDELPLAEGMRRTEAKHRDLFRAHPQKHAHFLRTTGMYYLKAGRWGRALQSTTRALVSGLPRAKTVGYWIVSVLGPGGLWCFRRARGFLRSHA